MALFDCTHFRYNFFVMEDLLLRESLICLKTSNVHFPKPDLADIIDIKDTFDDFREFGDSNNCELLNI